MPRKKSAPKVRAATTKQEPVLETKGNEVHLTIDTRHYRIRGLEKNMSSHQLQVNILATRDGLVHMDTLDLCKAKARASFVKATAAELFLDEPIIKQDVGKLLLQLEQLQQEQIDAAQACEKPVELSAADKRAAMKLLHDPSLTTRILSDYDTCGLVGEETNKLVCYLACVSRMLPEPLAILIQSGSAAGKTSLMDATLAFVPEEHQVRYSAMTGQSLYYMGRHDLKHKILAVAEEEGVAQASYALKLLQSDGKLRIAVAGKNSGTGRNQTDTSEVEGPVMMFLTTTAERPDVELQNRSIVQHVNESPEQTAAIHALQRSAYTLSGHATVSERQEITKLHQNAQRLLEPLRVVIPWADQLKFRHDQIRMRRDHAKYLSLIASITLLHQHQRPRKMRTVNGQSVEYLEATLDDAELANRLASQVMGQSLDALLPQTRQLLVLIDDYVNRRSEREHKPRSLIRFTQRELREAWGWSDFQIRKHLSRLVELEYVLIHRTGHGNQRHYELLYDGQGRDGEKFLLGLVDTEKLNASPSEGGNEHLAGRNEPHASPMRAASEPHASAAKNGATTNGSKPLHHTNGKPVRKTVKRE